VGAGAWRNRFDSDMVFVVHGAIEPMLETRWRGRCWPDVERVLEKTVWSPVACARGAQVLREALESNGSLEVTYG
jgi:hypothetical protein